MKKLVVFAMLLLPILGWTQRQPKIKGNRIVAEVRESLPEFDKIILDGDLEISLKQSFEQGYQITADDNLFDVLKFNVSNNTLTISSFYKIISKKKLEITVYYNKLRAITLQSGVIKGEDVIAGDDFELTTYSNAKLNVNINGTTAKVYAFDNSSMQLNLDMDMLNVKMEDKASADIYTVSESQQLELDEGANLKLQGTATDVIANVSGNAKLSAQEFTTVTLKLDAIDSVVTRINVSETLELNASGSAKTYLYGEPAITIVNFLDTTQLIKKIAE